MTWRSFTFTPKRAPAFKPPKPPTMRQLNTTPDGGLACAFGTPWLDHFAPPVGTGEGCKLCDDYGGKA